jgi:hypothetical protein
MSYQSILVIVCGLLSATFCLESHADNQYSWSGTIVPNGSSDPWLIGQQGQSFSLSGVVPSGATDVLDDSVQFSAFDLTNAGLVVGGQPVTYVGNGYIDFTDNSAGTFDVVLMGGEFQWFGTNVGIASAVALNQSTFSFTQASESLPVFPSTTNVDRITCCGGTYTFIVEAGSTVTVVPESTGTMLCLIATILVATTRRNNRFLYFKRRPRCSI